MRVLQVIHQFPPFSSQGSEVYCQNISNYLSASGDSVAVFHLSNTQSRKPQRLEITDQDGVKLFHCIDRCEYARMAEWPNPFLQQCFSQAIQEFSPDIIHFHNHLSLGDNLVSLAKKTGPRIIYTLHDFGLICPKALLLRDTMELCGKNSSDFFEGCCPTLIRLEAGRFTPLIARVPSLARWRQFAANQPGRARRKLLQFAVGLSEKIIGPPETQGFERKKHFFLSATKRIFQDVDLFLAPSKFLLERYVACGIPGNKIRYLRYGMKPISSPVRRSFPHDHLQIGYIGAFHVHKGVDLLLTAFRGLGDRATLHVHGSSFDSPISEAHFKKITALHSEGVVLHGRYNNNDIGKILADLDVVVVPSRWYENSPLTIQEAQMAGVPVITADLGGMAELVQDGVDGRHFSCNDAVDLRRVLLSIMEDPDQLKTLRANAPLVPSLEDTSRQLQDIYQELVSIQAERP